MEGAADKRFTEGFLRLLKARRVEVGELGHGVDSETRTILGRAYRSAGTDMMFKAEPVR